jgi:hypothetical protein
LVAIIRSKDDLGGGMNRVLNGILTWLCIAGGALTLADYWSDTLRLTDGAQGLLKHWRTALSNLWIQIDNTFTIGSEIQVAMALSLIFFYFTITVLSSTKYDEQANHEINDESDLSVIYLIIAAVLFASTSVAFIANYHSIFIIFDNIFVFIAFMLIIKGTTITRIVGAIAYTAVYTVLDDYIKSIISSERDFAAVVSGQLISIFVVFSPLILISNTDLLTRRMSNMLVSAGVVVGFVGALRLFKELKADAQSAFYAQESL